MHECPQTMYLQHWLQHRRLGHARQESQGSHFSSWWRLTQDVQKLLQRAHDCTASCCRHMLQSSGEETVYVQALLLPDHVCRLQRQHS